MQYVAYAFVQSPRKVSCAALNVTIASPGFGCRYSSRSFTQALNLTAVPPSGQRLLISSRHGRPTTRERGDRLHSCARDHAGLAVRGFERLFFQGLRCFPGRPAVAQRSALRWGGPLGSPCPVLGADPRAVHIFIDRARCLRLVRKDRIVCPDWRKCRQQNSKWKESSSEHRPISLGPSGRQSERIRSRLLCKSFNGAGNPAPWVRCHPKSARMQRRHGPLPARNRLAASERCAGSRERRSDHRLN